MFIDKRIIIDIMEISSFSIAKSMTLVPFSNKRGWASVDYKNQDGLCKSASSASSVIIG